MQTVEGRAPHDLLERPVFNSEGRPVGRVAAVGTRHGELRRIGIEAPGLEPSHLHFVACQQFTIERDRVVLAP